MELEGEDAGGFALGVGVVDAGLAVEPGSDAVADGFDFVFVPVALFEVLFAGLFPQQAAAVFFVELAPPAGADIGLVAAHFGEAFERFGAELDAAVAGVVDEFHFEGELEIFCGQVAQQEGVVLEAFGAADDLAVFDGPELLITVPAGEVFAVEEVCRVFFGGLERHLLFAAEVRERARGPRRWRTV